MSNIHTQKSTTSLFDNDFKLIRGGKVSITPVQNQQGNDCARMVIDGHIEHQFPADSRISRALSHTPVSLIEKRITNGSFFLKGDTLLSYKDGDKNHFTHTDESIASLIDHVGYTETNPNDAQLGGYNNTNSKRIRLQSVRSNVELEVPGYQTGNEFNSELSFAWSPFETHVSSAFRLVRLICLNGMTGMTSFLNTKVPLVNRWEEHLDITNKQIQNKITGMMGGRFEQMINQPATVRDVQRVMTHITNRLESSANQSSAKRSNLMIKTARMIDPQVHLTGYLNGAIEDGRVADQLTAHISMHTLWNMITELVSHTYEGDNSSNSALDKFANEVLFDRIGLQSNAQHAGVVMNSNFNNVEAALMHHQA